MSKFVFILYNKLSKTFNITSCEYIDGLVGKTGLGDHIEELSVHCGIPHAIWRRGGLSARWRSKVSLLYQGFLWGAY
jgi:hypothetical protein